MIQSDKIVKHVQIKSKTKLWQAKSTANNSEGSSRLSPKSRLFQPSFTRKCIRAAKTEPRAVVRQAFEQIFDLLGKIDQFDDDIIFFADEGGSWSWAIGVDWRSVLPVYFRWVAETVDAAEYVQLVDQIITKYCNYERPHHLKAAMRVATAAQKAALQGLLTSRR